eukprot:scaffold24809_cov49-Prasinocladus_malaysianus.AAC.1
MGLLETWTDDRHPCEWNGVVCECSAVYPPPTDCQEDGAPDDDEHVYGLDFSPYKALDQRLSGRLTPFLANLTEARV